MRRSIAIVLCTVLLFSVRIYAIGISTGEISVQINQKTGVVSSLKFGNIDVLKATQEVWSFENHEGKSFVASSMRNRVQKVEEGQDEITLTMINVILQKKGIGISVRYFLEEGLLIKRVELTNNSKEDLAVRAHSKTRVTDSFKKDGLYYVPVGEYCVPANEIKMMRKVDNQRYPGMKNQMMSLYNPNSGILAASFIYRVNEKFTTTMSGSTVASYLKDGWEFSAYSDFLRPGVKSSYDIAYYITKGSPGKLIRRWIQLKDIRQIRKDVWKNITVPKWLKDVSLVGFVYNPSGVQVKRFIPNLKPLADKIPGKMAVIQWGSSQRKLDIKGYGQPHPPQLEDIKWARNELPVIRKEMPNVKMSNYRYYWSMDDGSPEGISHPEWRQYDREGKVIFSGTSHRYARQPKIPAARKSCVDTTREWYRYVPMDFHYVDGTDGGFPSLIDWKHRMAAQWYDWHLLFLDVYKLIHSDEIAPEFLFCNSWPVSIGDAGFVEIGGNMTRVWQNPEGWRVLGDSCEVGKLNGPPQGFMSLLFWDKRTDLRYINHVLAYGLIPNLSPGGARYTGSEGLDFCLPRVPYIQAAFEIRNSKLVYPELMPDWRADGGLTEAIMMKVGKTYRLNVINHDKKSREIELSFDPAIINLAGKNVKLSQFELIPPETLIATKSETVFKVQRNWDKTMPAKGRCTIKVQAGPKVLNTIIISPTPVR